MTRRAEEPEDCSERAVESRKHVLAVQGIGFGKQRLGAVGAVDTRQPALGVDHPREPCARFEPVAYFSEHLARPVIGRDDFHNQVGGHLRKAGRSGIREAFPANETNVRRSYGIGGPEQCETGLSGDKLSAPRTPTCVPSRTVRFMVTRQWL